MGFLSNSGLGAGALGALGGGALATLGGRKGLGGLKSLFTGSSEKDYQQSLLGPEQQGLYGQMQNSLMGQGAGGAFGESADYYRDLLSDDSQTANMMMAPEMRRFNEQIVPGLAEQFAGMGSGGLSSSGFRNAAVGAGADLSERLGSIRAQLRQQGAQGLQQAGQFGLGRFNENIHRPASPGLFENIASGVGKGIGSGVSKFIGGM